MRPGERQQQRPAQRLGKIQRSLLGVEIVRVALPRAPDHLGKGFVAAAPVFQQPRADALQVAADRPGDGAAERRHPDHIVAEIGRASCRERVLQYVSISVVAASLKKKQKTKKY